MSRPHGLVQLDSQEPSGFAAPELPDFDVHEYLAEERAKDLLRFSTAGSVDDGKSTLIGRLLYDTQSVYDDQIRSIQGKGTTAVGVLDLALLTDGLRAEREQGITIDVAYRYFSTPRRKFIIADTPGHEQYTRNMATGASTADAAIVLLDARKGVLPQSRRHATITALLGVRHIIVAVNKMDLVGYDHATFERIREDFRRFFRSIDVDGADATELHFVPVSALAGDNVVHVTDAMPWYTGPSLLELLETLPSSQGEPDAPFRFAVQRVVRPNLDFRGFAGQIASGTVRPGDSITALPSGQTSRIQRIVTWDGDLEEAAAPLSVTLVLDDEIDISRGDLLASLDAPAEVARAFSASLVWMDAAPLDPNRRYLLKHTSRTVQAQVHTLRSVVNVSGTDGPAAAVETLALNGIGVVEIETLLPLALDLYRDNRHTGSFVLIDPHSNATVAAGMVRALDVIARHEAVSSSRGAVTREERVARFGHTGAHLALRGPVEFIDALERSLFERGAFTVRLPHDQEHNATALVECGVLVLTVEVSDLAPTEVRLAGHSLPMDENTGIESAVTAVLDQLRQSGVLRGGPHA